MKERKRRFWKKTLRGSTVKVVRDCSLGSTSKHPDWGWWIEVEGTNNRVSRAALREWAWAIVQKTGGMR